MSEFPRPKRTPLSFVGDFFRNQAEESRLGHNEVRVREALAKGTRELVKKHEAVEKVANDISSVMRSAVAEERNEGLDEGTRRSLSAFNLFLNEFIALGGRVRASAQAISGNAADTMLASKRTDMRARIFTDAEVQQISKDFLRELSQADEDFIHAIRIGRDDLEKFVKEPLPPSIHEAVTNLTVSIDQLLGGIDRQP